MAKLGAAQFRAVGLYDPDAPDAAQRLELLEYLDSRGVAVAAMIAADRFAGLGALASELPLRVPGDPLSIDDVAARSAATPDRVRRVRVASGLPPTPVTPGTGGWLRRSSTTWSPSRRGRRSSARWPRSRSRG